jgi:hypothetical protein
MRTIAASLILAGLIPTSVYAVCSEPQPRLVCAEYFRSQAVVEAKLVRSRYVAPSNDMDGHIYEMKTEKVLSGNPGISFDIWEENSSGRAGFEWKPGRSYLLFLISKEDRGWGLDGCGNSGPLEHAATALKQIREISGRREGIIEVAVGGDWLAWSPPMTNVKVSASSAQNAYSAVTNRKGVAEIHAPAGQYTVTVPNHRVQPFDFTYDDPNKVTIENGGCAQVQFVQSENR